VRAGHEALMRATRAKAPAFQFIDMTESARRLVAPLAASS